MTKDSRDEVIRRYQNIVKRWDEDNTLIKMFPDKYKEICDKLRALQDGHEFTQTDVTRECIMDMGAKIRDIQQLYGGKDGVLSDYSKAKYQYETDIPKFVDRVIFDKMA